MSSAPYVPLRIFSCYTMLEGAIEPKAIAKQAKQLDFPAVALTDRNGLYASLRPGLMASEVTSSYRWSRVIGTLALPLIFLPALFVPVEQMPKVMLPLAALMIIVRRVLLPRWVAKSR